MAFPILVPAQRKASMARKKRQVPHQGTAELGVDLGAGLLNESDGQAQAQEPRHTAASISAQLEGSGSHIIFLAAVAQNQGVLLTWPRLFSKPRGHERQGGFIDAFRRAHEV